MSSRRQKRSSNRPALLKTKKATKQTLLDELPNIDISLEKTIETLATSSLSSTSNNLKRPFKSSVLLKKKQKTVPQETPTSSSPKPTNASSEKQPVSNELNEDFDRVQLRFNFNNVMYSTNKNSDYFSCISPSNNFLYKKFPFEYDKWPKTRQPQTVLNTFLEKLTNENEETLEKKKERLNNFPSWIKLFSTELFNQLSSLYPYEVPENTCLKIGVHFQDEWPELQTLLEEYHQVFGNSKDLGKVGDEDLSVSFCLKIRSKVIINFLSLDYYR